MKENSIKIVQSILINKPRDIVWDYTQNYSHRSNWDSSIIEANVLQTNPNRMVRVKMKGNTTMIFVYKLDDRPNKTTLVAKDVNSPFIELLGGSWTYEQQGAQTLWTQEGSVVFKKNFLLKLLLPFYRFMFNWLTLKAMKRAKREIEKTIALAKASVLLRRKLAILAAVLSTIVDLPARSENHKNH